MPDWPALAVILLTYDRMEYAEVTLRSTLENLAYSGQIDVHIADDGSPDGYRERLAEIAAGYGRVARVTVSNAERRGYGASYNLATHDVHTDHEIILPLEDDWKLQRPLDIDPMVRLLGHGDIGCIRLGYIGYTQELRAKFIWRESYQWLELDPDSAEPHVFSGNPRLETVAFERNVGLWPEGLNPGETEFTVAHRRQARLGVVWPVDLIHPKGDAFVHIGTRGFRNLEPESKGVRA